MTAVRRLADPRLRPAWYAALAVAALAAFLMTGAVNYVAHPLPLAGLAALAAVLAGWWLADRHGTFAAHEGRHADTDNGRDKNQAEIAYPQLAGMTRSDSAPDTTAEMASMARLRGETAGQRAGYWAPQPEPLWANAARAAADGLIGPPPRKPSVRPESAYEQEPLTAQPALIKFDHGITEEQAEEFRARWTAACGSHKTTVLPDDPVVTVTEDPPGRHEKPRAYLVHGGAETYCARCGSHDHWTKDHAGPDPLVAQMVADRAVSRARHAIDDDLRAAGFKVYPGGEDDAVKSMFTRAMASAIAAVEAARNDG